MAKHSTDPLAVTPREAFKKLGISEYLGWQLIHDGTIPAVRVGRKRFLVSLMGLERLLNPEPEKRAQSQ